MHGFLKLGAMPSRVPVRFQVSATQYFPGTPPRQHFGGLFAACDPTDKPSTVSGHIPQHQRLYFIVLLDAIEHLMKPATSRLAYEIWHEALVWIKSDDPKYSLVSFVQCCDALGIDPGYLRTAISEAIPKEVSERAKAFEFAV